ncbi:MFS transporter [Brevibacillus migulae]|uniref:MFS transporter n=1 Tax=Brevibacillus migulae TaxID=1644114 RepID=UPI00106E0F3E|nr:MFS transporter [Brevibacillus migulae]
MRVVFGNPNFRKLFFSNLFNGFGQGMTMIGIAWYLVETTGTGKLLGSTMLFSSILAFLIGPYVGTVIDCFSRKKIMQTEQLGGFAVLAVMAAWGFWGDYQIWMLILIYLVTNFMYQIRYPTQSALVQETFEKKHYNDINSLLEIENQTAAVLSGGLAGLLLGQFGLQPVLMLNALTYLIAFLLMAPMDYVFTAEKQAKQQVRTSWWEQFSQSWRFIREKRGFMVFGVSSLMPFISIMMINLLNPVFVNEALGGDVSIFSLGEVTYSIGAAGAGLLVAGVIRKFGGFPSMVSNILLMAVAYVLIVALPNSWVFVIMSAFLGWCNASTRLIRQGLYMELLPNHFMGRVMSFLHSLGTLMRLTLLALFTFMIDLTGASAGYLVLAVLLLFAMLGIIVSMRLLMGQIEPVREE